VVAKADPAAIFTVDRLGQVTCARSAAAPHLTPQELAEALRNDEAQAALAELQAREAAEKEKQRAAAAAAREDPFRSRSSTPPAVGTGLVEPTEPAPATQPAGVEPTTDEAGEEEGADDEGEDADEAEGDEDEAEESPEEEPDEEAPSEDEPKGDDPKA
jgi:hypothetical protein